MHTVAKGPFCRETSGLDWLLRSVGSGHRFCDFPCPVSNNTRKSAALVVGSFNLPVRLFKCFCGAVYTSREALGWHFLNPGG